MSFINMILLSHWECQVADRRHGVNFLCGRDGRKLEILRIQSRGGRKGVGNEGGGLPGLEDRRG